MYNLGLLPHSIYSMFYLVPGFLTLGADSIFRRGQKKFCPFKNVLPSGE
jgi:hypothetical protein